MRKDKRRIDNPRLKNLGEALRNRRLHLELTQEQVAKSAELHRTYVTDVENGVRNLTYLTLIKLSIALSSPASVLLRDAETINGLEVRRPV